MSSASSDAWWVRAPGRSGPTPDDGAGDPGEAGEAAVVLDAATIPFPRLRAAHPPRVVDLRDQEDPEDHKDPEDHGTLVAGPPAAPPAGSGVDAIVTALAASPEPRRTPRRTAQHGPRRTSRRALVAGGAASAVLLTASVAMALRPDAARPTLPTVAAAAPAVVRVDPASVVATATSTQDPDDGVGYAAANTLDGDPSTAWNSKGTQHAASLTYTFARPLDLRDITLRNGYQKVRPRRGRPAVDLYPANARVHRLRVVSDAGSWTWDLADTRAPQTFTAATGRTGSVRLDVLSVYPSTAYPDVAISEVAFTATTSG